MGDSMVSAFMIAMFRGHTLDGFVPPLYYREPESKQEPAAPQPLAGVVDAQARRLEVCSQDAQRRPQSPPPHTRHH